MDQVIAFATLFLGLVAGPRDVELLCTSLRNVRDVLFKLEA